MNSNRRGVSRRSGVEDRRNACRGACCGRQRSCSGGGPAQSSQPQPLAPGGHHGLVQILRLQPLAGRHLLYEPARLVLAPPRERAAVAGTALVRLWLRILAHEIEQRAEIAVWELRLAAPASDVHVPKSVVGLQREQDSRREERAGRRRLQGMAVPLLPPRTPECAPRLSSPPDLNSR